MEKQKGPTLVGLIVTIVVILFIIAVIMPLLPLGKNRISDGLRCAINLKMLGTAMIVYANDYDDNYAQLPGIGP